MGYSNKLIWLTSGLKNSIKNKHRLHTKYLKHPTTENKNKYISFKNRLNHVLRITERHYYQQELSNCQNNMKKSWQLIKDIINKNKKKTQASPKIYINGHLSENSQDIANSFNKFFTEIGPILDAKIPISQTCPTSFIKKNCTINIFLHPVDEHEVNKIVDALKVCAVGWDDLPSTIFKENKTPLTGILTHIVNLSLQQGIFPSELKFANIIPIFKAGDT